MAKILFLSLAIIPIIEIAILIQIGGFIGAWLTVGMIIFSAAVGAILLRKQGLQILRRIQNSIAQNKFPTNEVMNGFVLIVAGILLITPGFLTDFIGLLLFSNRTRYFLGSILWRSIKKYSKTNAPKMNTDGEVFMGNNNQSENTSTIDGVYSDISNKADPNPNDEN